VTPLAVNFSYPQFCQEYPEYGEVRELQRSFEEGLSNLLEKVGTDIIKRDLQADKTVKSFFDKAKLLDCPEPLVIRATRRIDIGNPPGKSGLGDAINWECLLENADEGDIHFIADDKDYVSAIDRNLFKDVLLDEWADKKKGKLHYFKTLSGFLTQHYPNIDIESEQEKAELIFALASSSSFADTHQVVRKLRQFNSFNNGQAKSIVEAAVRNDQVGWIATDYDVADLLTSVIEGREEIFDREHLVQLKILEGPIRRQPSEEFDDDIPF
jgi:hypothetical protein